MRRPLRSARWPTPTRSCSGPTAWRPPTSSPSPGTVGRSRWVTRPGRRSSAARRSSTGSSTAPSRCTASPPGSAPWPTRSSRPSARPSCRRRSCARTPPAWARRSSARSSGRWSCCGPAAWPWASRAPGRSSSTRCSPSSTPASRRSSASTARSAPAATSRRWPRRRWCSSARARPAAPTGRSSTAPPRVAEAGAAPLVLRAKEGLALINGTDGMLGMLVLALADLDVLLRTADVAGAMTTEALLGTDRAFAEDLVGMRPQLGQAVERGEPAGAARRLGDRGQPPRRRRPGPGRLLAALHAAGPRRGPGHRRARPGHRRARAGVVHRQPGRAPRRAGRVVRQLPRRAGRRRRRLPGHLDRRRRRAQRAAHRPPARPEPLARPAAVPRPPTPASTPG